MPVFTNSSFSAEAGKPQFLIFSNRANYFLLGKYEGEGVWLEGKIVEGEFIFNGRLFGVQGALGTVIDSFPKAEPQGGWTRRQHRSGYELVDPRGDVVFSYSVDGLLCTVTVDLHDEAGERVAFSGQGGLVVNRLPMIAGAGPHFDPSKLAELDEMLKKRWENRPGR